VYVHTRLIQCVFYHSVSSTHSCFSCSMKARATAMQTWSRIEETNSTITKTWRDKSLAPNRVKELWKKSADAFDSESYSSISSITEEIRVEAEQAARPRGYWEYLSNSQMIVLILFVLAVSVGVFFYNRRRSRSRSFESK